MYKEELNKHVDKWEKLTGKYAIKTIAYTVAAGAVIYQLIRSAIGYGVAYGKHQTLQLFVDAIEENENKDT